MKAPLERDIQRSCIAYLHLKNILCWRQNAGAVSGEYKGKRRYVRFASMPGVSDILGILPGGRFLAVECKRPGKKPTPEQQTFLDAVNACGGLGVCVTSVDELIAAIENTERNSGNKFDGTNV